MQKCLTRGMALKTIVLRPLFTVGLIFFSLSFKTPKSESVAIFWDWASLLFSRFTYYRGFHFSGFVHGGEILPTESLIFHFISVLCLPGSPK